MTIKEKFKENPLAYYGLSIAASWAGVGSLMNTITITKRFGIISGLMWLVANSAACILFGYIMHRIPTMRNVMRTRAASYTIGIIGIFQIWVNMTGIRDIFADTVIGAGGGAMIAYAVAVAFAVLLFVRGMIRNVLTDSASWIAVYVLVALVTVVSFVQNGPNLDGIIWGIEPENLRTGLIKALMLLPGPFAIMYFYTMLDYNEGNEDKTAKVDMEKAFTWGGLMFGAYMIFAFILAFTTFSPALNLIKAILISLIAISTVSTFIYSCYVVFGNVVGAGLVAGGIAGWHYVMDMGVLGVWTMMAYARTFMIILCLIIAAIMAYRRKTGGQK